MIYTINNVVKIMLFDEVRFRDTENNVQNLETLITSSGYIEHMKIVARWNLKELILQLEMLAIIDSSSIKWEYNFS